MRSLPVILKLFFVLIFISVLIPVNMDLAAQEDIKDKTKEPKKEVVEKKDDEEGVQYLYDPAGKTDPFKSFIVVRKEVLEKEDERPKTYLETLELSQLTLSVIVIGPNGKWAMVRDSKGDGHVINEGTPVGINGGKVFKIREGEVIIREEYKDFRGRIQYKDISKTTPAVR